MSTVTEAKSIAASLAGISQQAKVIWMDNARIIACLFAVCLHTSAGVVTWVETGSLYWWMGNVFNSYSRWSLPVFVMISGALLLDKAAYGPIFSFYKKRLSRIFIPLVFWTIFYLILRYFGKPFASGETVSVSSLLNSALYGYPYYHLWYLYMVIGLYLFVPFLARVVRQSSDRELVVLCGALFIFSMGGNAFISYYITGTVPAYFTFIYYLPYFLAGYLIAKTKINPPAWSLWAVFIAAGAINSLGYYKSIGADGATNGYFYNCLNITVVPMAITVMFLLKRFVSPVISPAAGSRAALLSLGIYLIHPFFLNVFNYTGFAAKSFNPLWSIPLFASLAFSLSLTASYAIGKIPGFNKVIGIR